MSKIDSKAWADYSDEDEHISVATVPDTAVRGNAATSSTTRTHKSRSHQLRESREDCFARRGNIVLSFLDTHPFSTLTDVHAHLLIGEKSINHPFLPSIQSVHASLMQMLNTGKVSSRIRPGIVEWTRTSN